MNRIATSVAATGLLRALIGRARVSRNRIFLTSIQSVFIPFGHVKNIGVCLRAGSNDARLPTFFHCELDGWRSHTRLLFWPRIGHSPSGRS
jgi:hypothetical protein